MCVMSARGCGGSKDYFKEAVRNAHFLGGGGGGEFEVLVV